MGVIKNKFDHSCYKVVPILVANLVHLLAAHYEWIINFISNGFQGHPGLEGWVALSPAPAHGKTLP